MAALSSARNGRLQQAHAQSLGHSSLQVGATPGAVVASTSIHCVTHLNRRLSRESWLIAVQPISFMSRSISVCIRPSARSTPAWPAAAGEAVTSQIDQEILPLNEPEPP